MDIKTMLPELNETQRKWLHATLLEMVGDDNVKDDGSSKAFVEGQKYDRFRIRQKLRKFFT